MVWEYKLYRITFLPADCNGAYFLADHVNPALNSSDCCLSAVSESYFRSRAECCPPKFSPGLLPSKRNIRVSPKKHRERDFLDQGCSAKNPGTRATWIISYLKRACIVRKMVSNPGYIWVTFTDTFTFYVRVGQNGYLRGRQQRFSKVRMSEYRKDVDVLLRLGLRGHPRPRTFITWYIPGKKNLKKC